jgi:hypothetical protein
LSLWSFLDVVGPRRILRWRRSACIGRSSFHGLRRAKNLPLNHILDSFSENLRRHQFPRGSNSIPSFSRPEVSFICYVVILQQRIIGMMFLTTCYTVQPRTYAYFLISFFQYNGFGFLRLGRPTSNELCRLSFLP